jgi:hypothetical protein
MLPGKKILGIIIVSILIVLVIFTYKEYHREHVDVAKVKADTTVTAIEMIRAFEEDEATANTLFLGKTVEVKGSVYKVNSQGDSLVNIYLDANSGTGKVSCLVDDAYIKQAREMVPGSIHTIRGVCTGYLMDVELNRCVVIE